MEDNKKWLYDALSKQGYDLGDYKDYEAHSSEPESQKWLYDSSVKAGLDVGSFDEFQSGMNFNNTKDGTDKIPDWWLNRNVDDGTGKMPASFNIGGKELSREQLLAPANGQVTAVTDAVQPVKEVPKPIPVSEKKVTPASVYNEMEDQVLDKKLASAKEQPYYFNSYDDIRDHYFSRFSMTDEGKRSQTELAETQKDLVDMLSAKLKESQAYKDIMSSSAAPADKDTAIQALWETEYLPELDKQMEPFVNEYSQKVLSRYGKRMSDDTALLDKTTARNSWESIESRINEYENELEKRKGGWKDVSSPTYESNLARVQREVSSKDYNEKSRQVSAARSMMERSRKMIEAADAESEGTFVEGLARGFKDEAFNLDNWTMGLKGLADGQACLNVLEKCEKEGPESLNKEEKLLMDAIVSNAATQAYFQSELGRGYKAGSVTGASLPFMVDMMTGTAAVSASTKAATKGLMKWIAKNYSKNTIKKNITKGVTGLSKGVMDASIHTASFGMGRVADDYTQRGIGNVTFDSDGQSFQYAGRKGAESGLGAAGKAFASTALETQSELIGNQFAPSLKFVGRQIMRLPGLKNIPASKFGEYMKSVYGSASAKGVREFAKRAQFQGPIAEYSEEVYNNLGSVAIGDMTPEQLVDLDQNIDTFLGVGVMSAAFGLVGTGAFIRERYKTGKEIRSFEEKMKEHIDFDRLKADIKSQDIEGARTFVKQVMNDPSLSAEERKEEIKYIANVLKETAMNSVEAEMGKESLPQEDIEENKSAIFTEFETARKNMESALSPEIVGRIDTGEDIQNILSSEGLSEQQQDAIVDYHAAKVDFEDYISSVRNKVADARETARKEVEGVSNPDMGAVVRVNSNLSPDPVHIVGGTLAFDEEGFVDEKNSSDILYYLDENGVRKMASPSAFVSLVDMNDTDSVAQQAEDDAEKQTIAEEQAQLPQPYAPMVGDEVVIQEGIKGTVTGFTPEGDALVSDGNRVYVAPLNGIMPQNDAENEIPPQAEESKVSEETMQPKNSPVNPDVQKVPVETAPADTANVETEQPSSPAIPMDDKGNMLYHKAKIEDTLADLNDGSLEDNEIDDFISANRKEAMANLEKLEKKPPKMGTNKAKYLKEKADHKAKMDEEQQRIDYWDNVAKELKSMREKPGDAVADEILSMEEPMNGEEFAAQQLANGNLPLLQSSFGEETGFGRDEAKKYFGLFSSQEKGGMSIQEAGEALMQADRENGTNFFDQNDPNAGRDAIINVLAQATTKKELADIIKNNREAAAEKERVAEYEAYEQWCDEYFHMTPEDYESYQETWTSVVEEKYKDFDEQEFYGNIADELKQIENDTQGEITGTAESDAVLQGEELVPSGRTGISEGQQGSAIQAGLPGSDTNGALPEGASGEVVNSDRISSSNEIDENGKKFVLSSNGTTTFGNIGENSGLTPAPIKLSEGYQDENGKGYGLAHIEANHGEQIRKAGFASVEDFISYVAINYDEDNIRVGKRRKNGSPTFLIQITDTHDNTLFIELSKDSSYWNVNSAGIFRKGYSNKKETVVKTEPQQPNNAVSTGSSLSENEEGGITSSEPNGEPTVSEDKDSKQSNKKQETSEELLQNKDNSLTLPHKDKNEAVSESVSQSRTINQENNERRKVESLSGEGSSVNGTDEADTILRRAGDRTTTPLGQSSWTKESLLRDVFQRSKESKTWIEDFESITDNQIGYGGENEVYVSKDGEYVIKINNFSYLPNNSSNFDSFMNRVDAHNELFPNDAITVLGFAYNSKGEVSVVLSQPYIKNTREATQEEIDDFLENMGFYTDMSGNWTDGTFDIADTKPNNVLVDENGLLHFIDVLPYDSRKPGKMLVIPEQNQKKFEPSSIKPNENILDYAERVSREWNMHKARQSVNTNPTEAQKEAGNYKKGHIKLDGYDITIENPKGSIRSGRDANGQEWSIIMNNDYGYIRGTKAVDGDHIDIFLSDNPSEGNVFVVDQLDEKGEFDESKVMYGFPSMDEARSSYLANYSPGWENRISAITEVTKDEFYKWIDSSVRKTKPFSEYKSVNPVQLAPSIESANADGMKDIETRLAEIEDRKIKLEDILVEAGNDSVERDAVFFEQQELNQEQQELEAEYSGLRAMNDESNEIFASEGSDIRFREVGNEEISSFANKHNLDEADVRYRFIGEKGASQLDKAEEATTRLNNLNVAREMESAFNTKKGRIEKLRKSEPIEITGKEIEPSDDLKQYKKNALEYGKNLQGEYTNKDTGRTIQLQRGRKNGGLKEILQHDTLNDTVQIKSVAAIPSIIENAIYIDSSENQDVQKNPNVVAYHYYICGLKIGSEDYTVRMVEAEEKDGNRYYDHKLTHIEKGKLINELALINPSSSTELSSTPDAGTEDRNRPTNRGEIQTAPISNIKDKKLVSLLQTNEKENARKIKLATGWERGADGKWRYEVEDFEIDPKGLARKNRLWSNLSWGKEYDALSDKLFDGVELTDEEAARFDELSEKAEELRDTYEANDVRYLDDYVKDENLFKTYPELKQIRVEIYNTPTSNTGATYYGSQNLIRVNEFVLDRADFRSILAHEVQHAVQSIEGFARGGNSMTYRKYLDALKEKRDAWSMIEEFADKREELGEDASQMDVYNALVNEYHSDGFEFGDGFIPSRNAFDKGFNLWVRGYDKEGYEDAYNEYQSLIEKFGLGGENDRYNELSGEVEARNVQSRMNMTPEERRNTLASETEDVTREDQIFLNDALAEPSAMMSDNLDNVNQRFNDRLDNLNERNADRVTLSLGMPSDVLLSAGVSEKPLKLYGNKIIKKMKKHGFNLEELHDLPKAVANPIAVFDNYRKGNGSRSVLTELNTRNGNFLVTLNVGKGEDIDFNIVSSVFGKGEDNVVDWIERELATYINKEKALNYLHHSALRAEALSSSRLSHATKIVESFENPTLEQGKISSSVNELSKSLHTPVKVIRNVNEITDADGKTEQRKRKSKGWFDTSTGEVVLVLPNASSVEDARETVFHEAVAHYGLRKMFGKNFDTFLDNVYANAEQSIRSKINARGGNKRVATEEYLAELAERGFEDENERSLWQKVKDFFIDMLRKAGVKLGFKLSDNELRYILWKSYQNLSDNNVIDVSRDIAKQYELKVGEYRFRDDVTDNIPDDGSREAYEQSLKKEWYKAREAYQDSMLSLKNLQEVVAKTSGSPIQTFENAYMAENQMSSKNTSESEKYYNEFFEPLEKEIARLMKNNSVTYDELSDYMMLKHGIERNIEFSVRDAIKEVEKDQGFDTAKQMKEDYEADKAYLLEDLKNGILSEETYIRELEALGLRYAGTINDYSATRTLLGKMTGKALPAGVKEKKRDDAYIQMFEDQYGKDADVMALANDKVREFEQKFDSATLWKRINAATKHPLKKAYESGLMSKEAYEHTNDMFRFYVPLRGWEEKKADDEYEYLSSDQSPVNSVLRSAKGRRSIPDNPIPVIGNMAESTIMQGNKNVMKQYFLNMAMNHPTDVVTIKKAWYVKDLNTGDWIVSYPDIQENDSAEEIDRKIAEHEERMNKLKDAGEATQSTNGLNINYRIGKSQVQEHIVTVKRNGKDYTLFINGNPRAAQAINGMTNPDVEKNPMMKAIGTANRWLSANFTTRNPAFVLSNLTRDLIFAQSAVLVKESPEYAGKFFQNVPKAMKAILANLNGKGDMSKEIDRYFKEFLENGGETGYMTLTDVDKYKKKIKKDLERMTGEEGKAKHALRWCVDRMEDFNRWAEDVSRFTTYMTSRQMDRSITESVNDAKEVTVNFNKKGAGLKTGGFFGISAGLFRGLYLFFNAGVQSLTNFGRLAKKNPVKFGTMLGGFTSAGFVVPALINSFLYALLGGTGDDDPYMDLPEWVRRNNLCIYVGKGKFVTIPLPIELRAFYGLGEMAYSYTVSKSKVRPTEVTYDMANQLTELLPLNPLGHNGDVVSTLMPDVLKPFWQINQNEDFTGKPISKKTAFNELDPEFKRVYKGTSGWLVDSSRFLNEISGGSDFRKGVIDVNPAEVEHLFESYFGGMGKTLNQLGKTLWYGAKSVAEGERNENLKLRNIPVLNRFITEKDERSAFAGVNKEYYKMVDEFEVIDHEVSGLTQKASLMNPKYLKEYADFTKTAKFQWYKKFEKLKSNIDRMYKASKSIPEGEARKAIDMQILDAKRKAISLMEENGR